jgi:hypothetical protein
MKVTFLSCFLVISLTTAFAQNQLRSDLPAGYWPLEKSSPIFEKTQTITLDPDLSGLSNGERVALSKLLKAGEIFQRLYETQLHKQALEAHKQLQHLEQQHPGKATQNLLTLYALFQGPIATTLENQREPFLPVQPVASGKNVYPWDINTEEIESFLKTHEDQRDAIMDGRTVVRQATGSNLAEDMAKLDKYPALDLLHPQFKAQLKKLIAQQEEKPVEIEAFYAVPYSIAYSDDLIQTYMLLNDAASALEKSDEEFARYLRNRARDLLTNDYESGDAAWVTGRFKHLNAEIGSYETYDDELYGVKTFFAFSLLLKLEKESTALRQALKSLQLFENSLPYDSHKKISEDIPVGVYDVIADFGQARGGNTATILPNESYLARRYGRTILLRSNIMRNPELFERSLREFEAAVGPEAARDLTPDGNFYRTLWHEIGHYLGVDRTKENQTLDAALQETANTLEEMKADLVSLFVADALHKQGYYSDEQLKSVYASGIRRVLQNNRPRREQPYNTMELMQWNFFLENGLLSFDGKRLAIHYEKYHDVVKSMLAKTLEIQFAGDKTAATRFIDQYTTWNDSMHEVVARNIRAQQKYRYSLFHYSALGE